MSKKSAGIARDVPIAFEQLHTALNNYVTDPNASAEETMSSVEDAWTEHEANSSDG